MLAVELESTGAISSPSQVRRQFVASIRLRNAELALGRLQPFRNVQICNGSFEHIPWKPARSIICSASSPFTGPPIRMHGKRSQRVLKLEPKWICSSSAAITAESSSKKRPRSLEIHGTCFALGIRTHAETIHREAAHQLFIKGFSTPELSVDESYQTYYDTWKDIGRW